MVLKLAQKISCPEEIIPLYDFLQFELNRVLSIDDLRSAILTVDETLVNGTYWKEMRLAIGHDTQYKWKHIPNASWYFCVFAEQIRQVQKSLRKQIRLYNALQLFNNEDTPEFYEYCKNRNIQFSKVKVSNLKKCKTPPELPRKATFVLDFAFVNTQASYLDSENIFHFQYCKDGRKSVWSEQTIYMHPSTKYEPGTRISKPKYSKDSNGNYYGVITYDIEEYFDTGENIGTVDLGKINLYTFSVVKPDGTYSKSHYKESKFLERLENKIDLLYKEKNILEEKNNRVDELFIKSSYIKREAVDKWSKRNEKISNLNRKITNLKEEISCLMSLEIAELCKENNCNSVFVEQLNWLESTGGKWNHSQQQKRMNLTLIQNGIKQYKVPATNTSKIHPITNEIGKEIGRDIVFSDNTKIDRDRLATLNIGQRTGKRVEINSQGKKHIITKQGYKIKELRDKDHPTPKQIKRHNKRRTRVMNEIIKPLVNKTNRNTEMVVFLPRISNTNSDTTWRSISLNNIASKNSLLKNCQIFT